MNIHWMPFFRLRLPKVGYTKKCIIGLSHQTYFKGNTAFPLYMLLLEMAMNDNLLIGFLINKRFTLPPEHPFQIN